MAMTYEEMLQAWKDGAEIIDDDRTYKIVKPKTSSSSYDKKVFILSWHINSLMTNKLKEINQSGQKQ